MSFAWGADYLETAVPIPHRTFTGERPPARRTTDAAMAALGVGMTFVVAAVVVRAALRQDWTAVWTFGIGGVLIAVPSVVLCWIVIAWRLERRRAHAGNAEALADRLLREDPT
jgi:hypothetical protein